LRAQLVNLRPRLRCVRLVEGGWNGVLVTRFNSCVRLSCLALSCRSILPNGRVHRMTLSGGIPSLRIPLLPSLRLTRVPTTGIVLIITRDNKPPNVGKQLLSKFSYSDPSYHQNKNSTRMCVLAHSDLLL